MCGDGGGLGGFGGGGGGRHGGGGGFGGWGGGGDTFSGGGGIDSFGGTGSQGDSFGGGGGGRHGGGGGSQAGAAGKPASDVISGAAGASSLVGGAQTDTLSGGKVAGKIAGKVGTPTTSVSRSSTSAAVAQAADRARAALSKISDTPGLTSDLGVTFTLYDESLKLGAKAKEPSLTNVTPKDVPAGMEVTGQEKATHGLGLTQRGWEGFKASVARKVSDPFGQASTAGTVASLANIAAEYGLGFSVPMGGVVVEGIESAFNPDTVFTRDVYSWDQGAYLSEPGKPGQTNAAEDVKIPTATTVAAKTAAQEKAEPVAPAKTAPARRTRGRSYTIATSPFGYTDLAYLLTPRLVGVR